jgi:hypothetical protein
MKKCYLESISREISYMKYEKGRSHLTQKLPSIGSYRRKDKGRDGSDKKRGIRRKKLIDDLNDRRGYSHLKEEALDHTVWRNRFGKRLWTCRQTEY